MNNLKTYLSVLLLVCFATQAQAEEQVDLFAGPRLMTDTTDVVELAAAFCGFSVLEDYDKTLESAETETITYVDTTTPFIADKLTGRRAYKVSFPDVILPRSERFANHDPDDYPMKFEVYMDSISGRLLKVHITAEGLKDSEPSRIPYWEDATNWMKRSRTEINSLSEDIPQITLLDVFEATRDHPFYAQEVICLCAWESEMGREKSLRWDLYFFGTPPRPARLPFPIPIEEAPTRAQLGPNNMRNVVDASSGKLVLRTNFP